MVISTFILLFILGCTKLEEAEYCWTCTIVTTTVSPGATYTFTTTETICNMSTKEMELFEQGSTSGNTRTSAVCIKQ